MDLVTHGRLGVQHVGEDTCAAIESMAQMEAGRSQRWVWRFQIWLYLECRKFSKARDEASREGHKLRWGQIETCLMSSRPSTNINFNVSILTLVFSVAISNHCSLGCLCPVVYLSQCTSLLFFFFVDYWIIEQFWHFARSHLSMTYIYYICIVSHCNSNPSYSLAKYGSGCASTLLSLGSVLLY